MILTRAAALAIADIHHRQPVILDDDTTETWLKPGWGSDLLVSILQAGCPGRYKRRAVTRDVNSPRNDSAEILEPAFKTGDMGGAAEIQVALQ